MQHFQAHPHRPQGLGLVELLVGLAIGLLTATAAVGSLLISRQLAGAVSDAAQLQQQAAHAFRSIGLQVRQAGSVRLNLAFAKDNSQAVDAADPVAFEAPADFDPRADTVRSTPSANGHRLALAYQNYTEDLVGSAAAQSQLRDCLGQAPSTRIIRSSFVLKKAAKASSGELQCAGSNGQHQALIANVADFRLRFIEQAHGASGSPTMQYREAEAVTSWPEVLAVEICLEMEGAENLPDVGAHYLNCAQQRVARGMRLRLVFRNTYQIRSQGLPGGAP